MTPRSKIVGVYGLRWKFTQIQTQTSSNFSHFFCYTLAHPFYVNGKTFMATVNYKTNNIQFFAAPGKKTWACHYYKAEKNFKKFMETLFFLKKKEAK